MKVAWLAGAVMTAMAASATGQTVAAISAGQVRVEIDARLRTRIVATLGPEEIVLGPFTPSETVSAGRPSSRTSRSRVVAKYGSTIVSARAAGSRSPATPGTRRSARP